MPTRDIRAGTCVSAAPTFRTSSNHSQKSFASKRSIVRYSVSGRPDVQQAPMYSKPGTATTPPERVVFNPADRTPWPGYGRHRTQPPKFFGSGAHPESSKPSQLILWPRLRSTAIGCIDWGGRAGRRNNTRDRWPRRARGRSVRVHIINQSL